jgi:Protein of unknown function (DUF2490)
MFLLCRLSAMAQVEQFVPEVNVFFPLNGDTRLRFISTSNREDGTKSQAQIGMSFDFYVKPIVKLRRVFSADLDDSKSRLLLISPGYRYLPASSSPEENRFLLDATGRLPLKIGLSVSDRNRVEFRFIAGVYSWRYRNLITIDRPVHMKHYVLGPYASAEVFYDSRYSKWSETALTAGSTFPVCRWLQLDVYYEHDNETGKVPNQQVNVFGAKANLFFRR